MSFTFKDNSKEVLSAFDEKVRDALELIGMEAEKHAKENCPVDTGLLRNSINFAVKGNEKSVYIGTNVEYAPEQEYYHKDKAHFLRNAATNHNDEYRKITEKTLKS